MNDKKKQLGVEAVLAVLIVMFVGLAGYRIEKNVSEEKAAEAQAVIENENEKKVIKKTENVKETSVTEEQETAEVIADGQYPIMGESSVTAEDLSTWFKENGGSYPEEELGKGGADSIETFCQIYIEEAEAEGVKAEVAFAQTMKETGWLKFGGDASIEQFNFAGIGTTGGGEPGNSFPDVRTGVRAQIQHLKAYATEEALLQECVDERYEYVTKGCAPYVEWLGQQENPIGTGWATDEEYGYAIVEMIDDLKNGLED